MSNDFVMTTNKPDKKKTQKMRPMWRLRRTESGEIRFIPIREKSSEVRRSGGAITATLPTKVIQNDKVDEASRAIAEAGGFVLSVRGRMMTVQVNADNADAVGDVLDSFGCQWDMETN